MHSFALLPFEERERSRLLRVTARRHSFLCETEEERLRVLLLWSRLYSIAELLTKDALLFVEDRKWWPGRLSGNVKGGRGIGAKAHDSSRGGMGGVKMPMLTRRFKELSRSFPRKPEDFV